MIPLRKVEVKRLYKEAAQEYPLQAEVAFLLQSLDDPLNVGSMFRIADACGASELILSGRTPPPPHEEIDRTSRGHERRVKWRHIPQIASAMAAAKDEGYHLVALETAQGAKCYLEYKFPRKICLILGNESKGVYASTLSHCDGAVFIPMYGKGPSLNVHVAAALVAFRAALSAGAGGDP